MKLGRTVLIQSYPRIEDYTVRTGMVTFDHGNGTVDVIVFNSQDDIRDASMPISQSLGNVPFVELNAEKPTDYRGRWICTPIPPEPETIALYVGIWERMTQPERDALTLPKNGAEAKLAPVAKPNSPSPRKR